MSTTFVLSISLLFAVSFLFSILARRHEGEIRMTPKARAAACVVVAFLGVVAAHGVFYSLGYQAGSDRALRDNRAEMRATSNVSL